MGSTAGADDYVVKPFLLAELVFPLPRGAAPPRRVPTAIQYGDLVIDEEAGTATRAGAVLELTPTELRLLRYLVDERGRTVTKNQILTQVWGYDAHDPNVVEVHVSSLAPQAGEPWRPDRAHRARPGLPAQRAGAPRCPVSSLRWRVTSVVVAVAALLVVSVAWWSTSYWSTSWSTSFKRTECRCNAQRATMLIRQGGPAAPGRHRSRAGQHGPVAPAGGPARRGHALPDEHGGALGMHRHLCVELVLQLVLQYDVDHHAHADHEQRGDPTTTEVTRQRQRATGHRGAPAR